MLHSIRLALSHVGLLGIMSGLGIALLKGMHLLFGMTNQTFTGTQTSRRFALCPSSIVSGQPVLIGILPAVALDNYQANTGGTTFLLGGSFNLTVTGRSVLSPPTGAAIKPGSRVYADGGTLDAATNITYNFTLDDNTGGTNFGYIDPEYTAGVASNVVDTAAIVLLDRGL